MLLVVIWNGIEFDLFFTQGNVRTAYMDSAIKKTRKQSSHINNLAVVPHSCLEKADVRTRKKHSQKFSHIGYNIDPYGQSFFPNCISAWDGLAKDIAEANTLDIFKSKLQIRLRQHISKHIRQS